ncbi:MAG: M43 family zinc metalloprotease [Bacteroidia bacterium]|nr:M43 family zinc metalloprotease [Bacteroidia bacterium]
MKKIYLLFAGFFISFAQVLDNPERCFAVGHLRQMILNNPGGKNFYDAEKMAIAWEMKHRQEMDAMRGSGHTITIPVVFHVVYKNSAQNIHDSLIHSQIKVLNECFRKQNANYANTRPIFDSLGADVQIEFCLASKDPQGNPTSGIVRKQAPSNAQFNPILGFDNVKKPSKGGDTLWPPDQYLNIWTCDMSLFGVEVVLGYAQFPGMNSSTDGVVLQYNYVGKYSKPGFLGRTAVHEVGHWLGLRHIWGDDDIGTNPQSTYCDSTDYVDDTPNQGPRSNSNCNFSANTCTAESAFWGNLNPPDMIENYMDYSRDSCMTLFTKGQKARIYGFLNTDPLRMAIKTSSAGCNTLQSVINEEIISIPINIFPNPSGHNFQITFPGHFIIQEIILFTSEGKKVRQFSPFSTFHSVEELPEGLYLLNIKTNKGLIVKKLVKV